MSTKDQGPSESRLATDSTLVRAADVRIHLREDDEVTIDVGDRKIAAPAIALRILDIFARPRQMGEALADLSGKGAAEFVEASSVVLQLARAGVLVAPGARGPARQRGFVRPAIHVAMLDDRTRTDAYCRALRARVRPGEVVVDIGTGTGVLAAFAALAGAQRVHAVESTAIGDVAERLFTHNALSERVSLVRGRSTHVSLPERGTLLVTETIGNDPLDEQLLEIVADARKRLLTAQARVIPHRLEIFALPVDVPAEIIARHSFTPAALARWKELYGVDFAPLAAHRLASSQPIMIKTELFRSLAVIGEPAQLADIDLEGEFMTTITTRRRIAIAADSAHLGVILAFRAHLAEGIVLSTMPGEVDSKNAWRYALWPDWGREGVRGGNDVELSYEYANGMTTIRLQPPSPASPPP